MTDEVKPKKRGVKPKNYFKEGMVEETQILAARGLTIEQIRGYFGIKHTIWYELCDKYPDLADACFYGKSKGIAMAAGKLMELVKAGNLGAIIFYLKTQARFSEYYNVAALQKEDKANALTLDGKVMDAVEASKLYQQVMLSN